MICKVVLTTPHLAPHTPFEWWWFWLGFQMLSRRIFGNPAGIGLVKLKQGLHWIIRCNHNIKCFCVKKPNSDRWGYIVLGCFGINLGPLHPWNLKRTLLETANQIIMPVCVEPFGVLFIGKKGYILHGDVALLRCNNKALQHGANIGKGINNNQPPGCREVNTILKKKG